MYSRRGYAFPVRMCLTGNAYPHLEWGCASLGMHILTGNVYSLCEVIVNILGQIPYSEIPDVSKKVYHQVLREIWLFEHEFQARNFGQL